MTQLLAGKRESRLSVLAKRKTTLSEEMFSVSSTIDRGEHDVAIIESLRRCPQTSVNVVHSFGPGVYIREFTLPPGSCAIGHFHKKPHTCVLLKGTLRLVIEGVVQEFKAPMIFTSGIGSKLGYAVDEVVFLNIFATEERDYETLERDLIQLPPFEALRRQSSKIDKLSLPYIRSANDSFEELSDDCKAFISRHCTLQSVPNGTIKYCRLSSMIAGKGHFATSDYSAFEYIGEVFVKGLVTYLGSGLNHSPTPNLILERLGSSILAFARRDIEGDRGGLAGEELTVDYNKLFEEFRRCIDGDRG